MAQGYGYIECRARMVGHDWSLYGPTPGDRPPRRGFVFAHFICDRCGTTKRYEIHRSSGIVHGSPLYRNKPADYKVAGEGMTQAEWRLRLLKKTGAL